MPSRVLRLGDNPPALAFPKLSDMVLGLPYTGLLEAFRPKVGRTMNGGTVADWVGWNGNHAAQATGSKQPTYDSNVAGQGLKGLSFDGGDVLVSALTSPTQGYLVAAIEANVVNATTVLVGTPTGTDSLSLGLDSSGRPAGNVGNLTYGGLYLPGLTMVNGGRYVIGLRWETAMAWIRGNGVMTGGAAFSAGPGTGILRIGGRTDAPGLPFTGKLLGWALYSGTFTSDQLAAIDRNMAVFAGITI